MYHTCNSLITCIIPAFACYRCCILHSVIQLLCSPTVGIFLSPNFWPRNAGSAHPSAPHLHQCLPAVSRLSLRCQPQLTSWILCYPRPSGKHPPYVHGDRPHLDLYRHPQQVIHKNFKISRIRNFYMRKVKFTQDSFDEKLSAILSEFPMLDVCPPSCVKPRLWSNSATYIGPASVLVIPDERIVRQESLQACPRPITHRAAPHRPGCKRLRPATEVWRQLVPVQTVEKGGSRPVRSMPFPSPVKGSLMKVRKIHP